MLSPAKRTKILRLYFKGVNQKTIAKKAGVNQATVSRSASRFQDEVDVFGLESAAEEVGVMKEVVGLRSLAVELAKNDLTVEEAEEGVAIWKAFANLGVPPPKHKILIKVASEIEEPAFVPAAMKLVQLEAKTGKGYYKVVAEFEQKASEVSNLKKQVENLEEKKASYLEEIKQLKVAKKEKEKELETTKEMVGKETGLLEAKLAQKTEETGLTLSRMEKLDPLAKRLTKLKITDDKLEEYLSEHIEIEKSGIGWYNFTEIVEAAKADGEPLGSKKLAELLANYGSLVKVVDALGAKKSVLEPEVAALEKKNQQLEASVESFKQERKELEAQVKSLGKTREELTKEVQEKEGKVKSLGESLAEQEAELSNLQQQRAALSDEVKQLEGKQGVLVGKLEQLKKAVADEEDAKKSLEAEIAKLKSTHDEVETRLEEKRTRLKAFESFLGLLHATSKEQLLSRVKELPEILTQALEKEYSSETLWDCIISRLSGNAGSIFYCKRCNAEFAANKPAPEHLGYTCPICSLRQDVSVKKQLGDILKPQLTPTVIKVEPINIKTTPISPGKKDLGKDS